MPSLPKPQRPRYLPAPQQARATGDQAFYNGANWRKLSLIYRANSPLCENCQAHGRLNPCAVVDHVIPMPHGEALDAENFMSLCHACHNQKSGMEGHAGAPLIPNLHGLPVDRNEIFKLLK